MTDGTLTAVGADGSVKNALVKGRSYAGPLGREHDVVNDGDREIVFVEIELKEAPRL
jgi:mannose-6-phosphate isomerase-like protein (cupin superfamily)